MTIARTEIELGHAFRNEHDSWIVQSTSFGSSRRCRCSKATTRSWCDYPWYTTFICIQRLSHQLNSHVGKANLSEFSHFRGSLPGGWSGRGGQSTSAYFPHGDPGGSSSGSGIAASIGLATVTLGTDTHGSITCPSGWNNVVGIKPTVGLTSRAGGKVHCALSAFIALSNTLQLSLSQSTRTQLDR